MPEFSACYFCGAALDEPLAEYPVVPDALGPTTDQQRTVVLCSSCRRKLGAVVDAVIDAVDDRPAADSIQHELADANDGEGAMNSTGDVAGTHDGVDVAGTPDDVDGESGFEFGDASSDDSTATDRERGDDGRPTGPAGSEDGTVETTQGDPGSGDGLSEKAADPASPETDEAGSEDGGTTGADGTTGDEDSTVDDGASGRGVRTPSGPNERGADGTDPTGDGGDDEPQLTALEYNKVLRLLQNREFPVDHAEFKVVATNAYEIREEEFDAIIEAAVDRGLIGLDGGRIVES